MIKWPVVSVVMSNYNGLKLNILDESLESILNNDYPNLEVILVDNASTDKSVSVVQKKFGKNPRLKIIQNSINMYSKGLNLGVKNSQGEYVAFFNNDVVVEDGFFQKIIYYLKKNSKVALVQGKLLSYFDHSIIDSAGETIDAIGSPITIGAHLKDSGKFDKTAEVLSASGSCSLLNRSAVEKMGLLQSNKLVLFDEDYGIGYEDLDLALRVWLSGYKVMYFPEALAFHKRGVTDLSEEIRVKVRWHFNKNRIITMLKNYSWGFILRNLPGTVLIYLATGMWEIIVKGKPALGFTRFTSIIWVLMHLSSTLRKRQQIQKTATRNGKIMIEKLQYRSTLFNFFLLFIKAK